MKTGLTPAESMVVNGGERSNAAPAGSLPPCCRHTRLTIVRRSCKRKRIAGIHGEAMYTAPTLRSACSYSSLRLPMSGVEGDSPRLSLGDPKGGILFGKRIPPFIRSPMPMGHFPSLSGTRPFLPKARLCRRRRCRPSSQADIKPRGRSTRRPS